MTIVKTSYSLNGGEKTWEQASFDSATELWDRYNTFKNFSIKPYLDSSNSEMVNLRKIIDDYINLDLYLQKIDCVENCSNGERSQHKVMWYALTANSINAIKKYYPKEPARMIEIVLTVINKQKDYGHQNIAMFGITGLVIRLHDKIARAENLLTKKGMENSVPGESLYDTFTDIIGYSIIAIMWLNNTFMFNLEVRK